MHIFVIEMLTLLITAIINCADRMSISDDGINTNTKKYNYRLNFYLLIKKLQIYLNLMQMFVCLSVTTRWEQS
jgi:hypothetical protein